MIYTISVFNTGQITIPKKIREGKFKNAKKLLAEETDEGIIIRAIPEKKDDLVYYESSDKKEFGLLFPSGMDPENLIKKIEELDG